MLSTILLIVAALIVLFLIVVALQPAAFRLTRSATISAPPRVVFAQVNDFHNWDAWSPWAKLNPAVKNTFDGTPAGQGAIFAWSGNNKVGEGRMTIIESHPDDLIKIDLEFIRPFAGKNLTEFTFKPQGNQTLVSWTMSGRKNFMSKAFCMCMNMDKTVGKEFDKGLVNLNSVSQARNV